MDWELTYNAHAYKLISLSGYRVPCVSFVMASGGGESEVIVISSDSEDSDSTEIITDCDSILTFTPTKRQVTRVVRR